MHLDPDSTPHPHLPLVVAGYQKGWCPHVFLGNPKPLTAAKLRTVVRLALRSSRHRVAADTRNASMARGSMSVLAVVENFCVNTESRKRTATTVGQPSVKAFAFTKDKEVAASFAAAQAFVNMEMNGTGARIVGIAKTLNIINNAIRHT